MTNTKNLVDYDVRVRDRNLKSGLLRREDVDRHLSALPDLIDHAQLIDTNQPGTLSIVDDESDDEVEETA